MKTDIATASATATVKKKVYIWGAGYYAEFIYSVIDRSNCSIEGVVDSDLEKQGKEWGHGLFISSPDILLREEFSYVFISPRSFEGIKQECINMQIPSEKIVVYWEDHDAIGLFENRAGRVAASEIKCRKYENRLNNAPFEWGLREVPVVKSSVELLNRIIAEKCSLCRYGDGEFEIMSQHERPWFQRMDAKLAERLRTIIVSDHNNIVIALADNFANLEKYKEDAADDIREYMIQAREEIYRLIDIRKIYYNAYVSRPYIIYRDKRHAEGIFELFKRIWKDRRVLLIEGAGAKIGIGNDLFKETGQIKRIVCPDRDAWNKYDEILDCVRQNAEKDDLICISLGPTATVLAYDLADAGYQALDIGQLDNEYEWYIRGVKKRVPIAGKMVAEVSRNCCESDGLISFTTMADEYKKQIVAVVE